MKKLIILKIWIFNYYNYFKLFKAIQNKIKIKELNNKSKKLKIK